MLSVQNVAGNFKQSNSLISGNCREIVQKFIQRNARFEMVKQ